MLGAFLIYILVDLVVLQAIRLFFPSLSLAGAGGHTTTRAIQTTMGWLQLVLLGSFFLILALYLWLLKKKTRKYIFWGEGKASIRRLFEGIRGGSLAWLISYPCVLLMGILGKYLTRLIWGPTQVEQAAVKQLKMTMQNPFLFLCMIVMIIFLVPIMEELLFRGFLQNSLKRYLGRWWAILLTAILFACAHFSSSQGVGNLQLILSLFVLAFFLGFVYEKTGTLWAPIGLHMMFNAFNVLLIALDL